MKHAVVKISALMVMLITTAVATPTHWRLIAPGIEYTQISMLSGFHTGYLYAFRIDLSHNQLRLAISEDHRNKIATVSDLVSMYKSPLGVNGGFFSQELKPLGLRISDYKLRYPLKATPWWSIFYVVKSRPFMANSKEFRLIPGIEFALQSGPRLIRDNKIPLSLKPGIDSRTAIGITPDDKVILAVTGNLKLTTMQLARIMRASQIDGGLGCKDAMNLDGGSSTQASAKTAKFSLEVPSFTAVTDAILVVPK